MANDYKIAKEAFVSDTTGSSIFHINLISLVALASVSLYAAICTRLPPTWRVNFLLSWSILVLPLLLSMTIFAMRPILLSILLFIPTAIVLLLFRRREMGTPLPSSQPSSTAISHSSVQSGAGKLRIPPLPALTTYRAHMLLMTFLAILAVDFPVFPRALAKCETYGASLMDLGVGSFVFSQGIVSAIPLLTNPGYITSPLLPKLIKVTRKCFPIILLGLVRVLLVKGTEYPEHVSEYGTHWNFFITLALLPILQVLLHPVLIYLPISLVGILIAIGHQLTLSNLHLKNFVLSAPRKSIVSSNKEGIVSLTGYLAIHILGLSAGTLILPPSPSFFRRRQQELSRGRKKIDRDDASQRQWNTDKDLDLHAPRQTGKITIELCSYAIVWWSLLGLTKISGHWLDRGDVSRRMVNFPYIIWVVAFNTSFLLSYLVVLDLCFFPRASPKKTKKYESSGFDHGAAHQSPEVQVIQHNPPALFIAINEHGLPLFLLANVLTGVVNLAVPTMYTGDLRAMCILSVYSILVCVVAWVWTGEGHKIR